MFVFCFVQYSKSAQEIRRFGFRFMFRCLGKYLEHRRKDRDQYVQIFPENIKPGYTQHAVDF